MWSIETLNVIFSWKVLTLRHALKSILSTQCYDIREWSWLTWSNVSERPIHVLCYICIHRISQDSYSVNRTGVTVRTLKPKLQKLRWLLVKFKKLKEYDTPSIMLCLKLWKDFHFAMCDVKNVACRSPNVALINQWFLIRKRYKKRKKLLTQ